MKKLELFKAVLLQIVDDIDTGNSNVSDDEMNEAFDIINKMLISKNKLSKYQACEYLNISRATFDNWVRDGKIPEGKKEQGFKEKFWEMEDLKRIKKEVKTRKGEL